MNENVNAAIAEAFEKGLTDRTTLMVNMPFAKEGAALAKEKGFMDRVGLHINLTSGRPLCDAIAKDPVMCNSGGEFSGDFARSLKTRFFLPKKTAVNVEKEIRAQLDMYKELGGTLWHVDSHHHVHTDPSIWRILKKVLRDYPVTSVRLGRNMISRGKCLNRLYKCLLNSSIGKLNASKCDYFGSANDFKEFEKDHPDLTQKFAVEVMVHPVYDNDGKLSDVIHGSFYELLRLN